jgi:hypothetical protein
MKTVFGIEAKKDNWMHTASKLFSATGARPYGEVYTETEVDNWQGDGAPKEGEYKTSARTLVIRLLGLSAITAVGFGFVSLVAGPAPRIYNDITSLLGIPLVIDNRGYFTRVNETFSYYSKLKFF